jgi:PAS domain-containing protein
LFGSALREDFDSDSGVDLLAGIRPGVKCGLFEWVDWQEGLARIFSRRVDLVSRRAVERGGLPPATGQVPPPAKRMGGERIPQIQTVALERVRGMIEQVETVTGRIVRVNDRFCAMFGYTAGELLNMTYQSPIGDAAPTAGFGKHRHGAWQIAGRNSR